MPDKKRPAEDTDDRPMPEAAAPSPDEPPTNPQHKETFAALLNLAAQPLRSPK